MARLVIVSNRTPNFDPERSEAGGLAVALRSMLAKEGGLWLGWSGHIVEDRGERPQQTTETVSDGFRCLRFDLRRGDYEPYYAGFSNATLWPLLHYRVDLLQYHSAEFAAYKRVNEIFAETLAPLLREEDIVWVHDYHLFMLAQELRARGVRNRIGFFLHTPFPPREVFSTLPVHRELAQAMACYDLIGTQTDCDASALRDWLCHDLKVRAQGKIVQGRSRRVQVDAFPISIDVDSVRSLASRGQKTVYVRRLAASLGQRSLIMSVDRLDYTKGILHRFDAFERVLKSAGPNHEMAFLQIAPVSRDQIQAYRELRQQVEQRTSRLNGSYEDMECVPLRYISRPVSQNTVFGLYRQSAVGVVTPLRDGMNLVAKEYVASQPEEDPGVLVLSQFAGAAQELDAALLVNPYDVEQTAKAIEQAVAMPLAERRARHAALMVALRKNEIDHWRTRFLDALAEPARANPMIKLLYDKALEGQYTDMSTG